ncbi:MAG: glycoside hydrolase, partial [Opitutales bacterium]
RQYDAAAPRTAPTLFRPAPAVRIRASTNTDTPLPPDEPVGENPPEGAILDYLLPPSVSGHVSLEILDSHGKVVRRYADTDPVEPTEADLARLSIPAYWVQRPVTLPAGAGAHRWVWDLHYTPPESFRHQFPMAAVYQKTPRLPRGPAALPGQYQVRLNVGTFSTTAPLMVTMDPRVGAPLAELQGLFDLQRRLGTVLSRSTRAIREGRSLIEQLDERAGRAPAPLAAALGKFKARLLARLDAPASEEEPGLGEINREASEAYGQLNGADAAPTKIQGADTAQLEKEFHELLESWENLLSGELDSLNSQLKAASLPALKADRPPDKPDEAEEADLD